jgi:hypothetical protein
MGCTKQKAAALAAALGDALEVSLFEGRLRKKSLRYTDFRCDVLSQPALSLEIVGDVRTDLQICTEGNLHLYVPFCEVFFTQR